MARLRSRAPRARLVPRAWSLGPQGGRGSRPTRGDAKPSEGPVRLAGCRGTALAAPLPDCTGVSEAWPEASSSEFGIAPEVIGKPGSVSPRAAMGIIRLGAALL